MKFLNWKLKQSFDREHKTAESYEQVIKKPFRPLLRLLPVKDLHLQNAMKN